MCWDVCIQNSLFSDHTMPISMRNQLLWCVLYSLGASQSTQKLFPLTFRMDWMAIASLWLPNRDCGRGGERENGSPGTNYLKSKRNQNNYSWTKIKNDQRAEGGKSFFKVFRKKKRGRGNMNMKMRPCLPSMLTQAVFYLWCLSVLIRDPPHCGAPVWQPPTCDSLKWVRRGGGGGGRGRNTGWREEGGKGGM